MRLDQIPAVGAGPASRVLWIQGRGSRPGVDCAGGAPVAVRQRCPERLRGALNRGPTLQGLAEQGARPSVLGAAHHIHAHAGWVFLHGQRSRSQLPGTSFPGFPAKRGALVVSRGIRICQLPMGPPSDGFHLSVRHHRDHRHHPHPPRRPLSVPSSFPSLSTPSLYSSSSPSCLHPLLGLCKTAWEGSREFQEGFQRSLRRLQSTAQQIHNKKARQRASISRLLLCFVVASLRPLGALLEPL